MAKTAKAPKPSSNGVNPVVLIVGGLIVVGLLTFSLSRSFRKPAATPAAGSDSVAQSPVQEPVASATVAPQQGVTSSLPPMASPRGNSATPAVPLQPSFDETGGATPQQIAAVPRTKPVDLLQKLEAKQVTIIDVRDVDSYQARHIPGALHIPLAYIAGEVPYLPKDKPIVTYCT